MDLRQEDTLLEILERIVKTPAMFWGDSDNHFHSFVAFVSAIACCRLAGVTGLESSPLNDLIPADFHEFVTAHFGHSFPHGGHGWSSLIEMNSKSDHDALNLVLTLRRSYQEQQCQPNDHGYHRGCARG
jgi:hypothetical protein